MPTQRTLFDDARTIQERFEDFHRQCPDVFEQFKRIALQLHAAGVEHFGAKAIAEVVRFERVTSSQGSAEFKINNSFVSRYARMLVEQCPHLAAMFEFRKLKSE